MTLKKCQTMWSRLALRGKIYQHINSGYCLPLSIDHTTLVYLRTEKKFNTLKRQKQSIK